MGSLDLILTAAALIVGVMLLTGHGEIFMKGGNAERLWGSTDPDRYHFRDRYVYYKPCSQDWLHSGSACDRCRTGILSESKM